MRLSTRFVSNTDLWNEIHKYVSKAKHARAAVAYFGQHGANLLPLKKGDELVVDMSLGAVRQGVTDPREIRKLKNRGVKIFSRGSLHAKFLVTDKILITSSANASKNSEQVLDEAGVITADAVAIRRAADFFDRLCTEPVRKGYLEECIKAYRPPKFKAAKGIRGGVRGKKRKRSQRIVQAKLWFIGGLQELDLPDDERKSIEKVEKRAQGKLRDPDKTYVSWIRYSNLPKFFDQIRPGDWVIDCTSDNRAKYISPPTQVLSKDSWQSLRQKKYYMIMLEVPNAGETIVLGKFRRKVRSFEPGLDRDNPRTRPIQNNIHADEILKLWTPSGRVSSVNK